MAIHLEANYSKKLGLPGYSSHQYSLTLKTEINDLAKIQAQSAELHQLLQFCVDRELQTTGFLPATAGSVNGQNAASHQLNGNGRSAGAWACSQKQKTLILKLVEETSLDKTQVEILAQTRFGKSVRALTKPQASELIDELRSQNGGGKHAQKPQTQGVNGHNQPTHTR